MTAAVQPGIRRAQEIPYGKATGVLYAWPERDGVLIDPATATVSIYLPGESTPTINAAPATETADHQLTYTLDATSTSTWYLNLQALAEFTGTPASGEPVTVTRPFRIVRTPMVHTIPLRVDDLYNAHRSVEKTLTQAGITDANKWIIEAWEEVLSWCESNGKIPGFIKNADVLVPMLRARSRSIMCRALALEDNSLYGALHEKFQKDFENFMLHPGVLDYDAADTRTPEREVGFSGPIVGISGREHARGRGGLMR